MNTVTKDQRKDQRSARLSSSVILQWFSSKTFRHAGAMRKHVRKLLNHQRDILSPQAIEAIEGGIADLEKALTEGADKATLEKAMEKLETVAGKSLKPYPNAAWRENIEVLLVALSVAMGIRTFFLQPFKIPTGSMQPTLYGVTSTPDYSREDMIGQPPPHFEIPTGGKRIREWFEGISYLQVRAKVDGELEAVNPPVRILIFNIFQTLRIGGVNHWILFPPDYGTPSLERRMGLRLGTRYKEGDEVVRMKIQTGDHLFVDRLSFNFRTPDRGEIIVFETRGIDGLQQDQFYIKRLVALGSERVQLGNDRHLIINGKRLDASTPHFEKVYSFNPKDPPLESHYSGHVNLPHLAPYFLGKPQGVEVPKDYYMVMGDNTMNSLDSRAWGPFPATNVIGKSFFVYWPITERFGWGYHR